MSLANILVHLLCFDDSTASNNPSLKSVDWKTSRLSIPVTNPKGDGPESLLASSTTTILDTTISTSIDGTSAFSLVLSTLDNTRYIISNTGGTAPAFRTDRTVAVASGTITVASLSNGLVTFTHSGTPFGSVVVGDTVFIPGVLTGDTAGPFSFLNEGYWTVAAKTSSVLTLSRFTGEAFSAQAEGPISIAANSEFQVFSAAGIQVGDTINLSAGFQANALKSFTVLAVTAKRIEIQSTLPLANETAITPTATGMLFYRGAKRLLYIEADQACVIRLNGDTSSTNVLEPWAPAEDTLRAQYIHTGPVWKLVIVNKATVTAHIKIITAE